MLQPCATYEGMCPKASVSFKYIFGLELSLASAHALKLGVSLSLSLSGTVRVFSFPGTRALFRSADQEERSFCERDCESV